MSLGKGEVPEDMDTLNTRMVYFFLTFFDLVLIGHAIRNFYYVK